MKGIDALIASVLIILISVTAIFIALQLGAPSTERVKEIMLMQEGKGNLVSIDNAVESVLTEGQGSARALKISVSGGTYSIGNDSVTFAMESSAQIVGVGVSKTEDEINITGASGMVYLSLYLSGIQISGSSDFGRGSRTISVRNDGYNETAQKQMIYISPSA